MDILNYLSGYHALNNFEDKQANLDSLFYCVVAFENFDVVCKNDVRTTEWRDHLVLRCRTNSFSRNHIPVIWESADSGFWSHELFEKLDAEYDEFAAIDLCQPTPAQIQNIYLQGEKENAWTGFKYICNPKGIYSKLKKAIQ